MSGSRSNGGGAEVSDAKADTATAPCGYAVRNGRYAGSSAVRTHGAVVRCERPTPIKADALDVRRKVLETL